MTSYSPGVALVLTLADAESRQLGHAEIEPSHLLLGLCKVCGLAFGQPEFAVSEEVQRAVRAVESDAAEVRRVLTSVDLDWDAFRYQLRESLGCGFAAPSGVRHRSHAARRVFERAEELARGARGLAVVRAVHLLAAVAERADPAWAGLLAEMGVPHGVLVDAILASQAPEAKDPEAEDSRPGARREPSRAQPTLSRFGRNLTRLAVEGRLDPVVGRDEVIAELALVLVQERKNNAILLGETGVGKTAIVEGLARHLAGPECPQVLEGMQVVEVGMSALVAGCRFRGDFEERMESLVREAAADPRVVLFIDEIHTLIGAGGTGGADAANMLKPALARGEVRCIGATTNDEYRRIIISDPALERRFYPIRVNEPSRDEAIAILDGLRPQFEGHHNLMIGDDAIAAAVDLAIRYLADRRLPDKAIDLIDRACAQVRMAAPRESAAPTAARRGGSVTRDDVIRVVARRCRVPIERLERRDADRLIAMEQELSRRVLGQEEAVRTVSETVRTAQAGLKPLDRPTGVFLFAGRSGTGKTELAKALAEFLFGDEGRLIRIDMSEFMLEHSVARLIGSPPGFVGFEEGGQLTERIREVPFSVVLLDEIEKAHPRILDLFLQVFSEGRLTDARGRLVSFRETLIVMTTNLGCDQDGADDTRAPFGFAIERGQADDLSGWDRAAYRHRIQMAIEDALRPELLNRIGQIVYFDPLDPVTVRGVIDKTVTALKSRAIHNGVDVVLTAAAYEALMAEGYSPSRGAREMERVIERRVVHPLARALLEGRLPPGGRAVVDALDGVIVVRPDTQGEPPNRPIPH